MRRTRVRSLNWIGEGSEEGEKGGSEWEGEGCSLL